MLILTRVYCRNKKRLVPLEVQAFFVSNTYSSGDLPSGLF